MKAIVLVVAALVVAMTTPKTTAQSRLRALPLRRSHAGQFAVNAGACGVGTPVVLGPRPVGQKDVACATCHHPAFGYSDGLDVSIGVNGAGLGPARAFVPDHPERLVKRNSQTVVNVAFNGFTESHDGQAAAAPMFWDLRVRSLEAQALEPIKAQEEMRGGAYTGDRALPSVVARLNAIPEYRQLFVGAFAGASPVSDGNLGRALAAFQRTIVATNTPFDRYIRGDTAAMSPDQIRGMERFQTTGCINCHSGPMFSDYQATCSLYRTTRSFLSRIQA